MELTAQSRHSLFISNPPLDSERPYMTAAVTIYTLNLMLPYILLSLAALSLAQDWPKIQATHFHAAPVDASNANGWNMTGSLTFVEDWEDADQRLEISLNLDHPQVAWRDNGFYMTYLQLIEPGFSNETYTYYSNFVCSMRLNPSKPDNFTSSDLYQSNSCGDTELWTIQN